MCRNIRPLFNFEPPAEEADVRNASLQFIRKIAGTTKPSKANEHAFNHAVDEVTESYELSPAPETFEIPAGISQEPNAALERLCTRIAGVAAEHGCPLVPVRAQLAAIMAKGHATGWYQNFNHPAFPGHAFVAQSREHGFREAVRQRDEPFGDHGRKASGV